MKKASLILISLLFISCNDQPESLAVGVWRAEMQLTDTEVLPFNFDVTSERTLKIYNADEVVFVDDISYVNDSVYIKMPVFEGYIAAKMKKNRLEGSFIKESLDRIVPFTAEFNNKARFLNVAKNPKHNVTGSWEVVFSEGVKDDEYIAKGIFNQDGNKVTGTFRTTTGDYRYLEGVVDGNQLKLSTFDGAHVFLFTANVSDSIMKGHFYSGNHWKEPFIAKRNDSYDLPNANSLTFLKEGFDKFDFSFPDAKGNQVSLSDDKFKDKVVLVQVMGTWCPNCLDESKFYSEYYKRHRDLNFEIVALAFEYAKTEEKAFKSIERLQENLGLEYPVLLAQHGTSSKIKAQEKLPMLNHVLSYPTSIFIDKKGNVRKIHTGFNGPATREKYVEFKEEFEEFIQLLSTE